MTYHDIPDVAGQVRGGGFTYIGLLLAISTLGILLTVASDIWHTAQKREREAQLLFAGDEIRRALARYYFSTPGGGERYPRNLEDLLKDPRYPAVRRHLRRLYPDPMTGSIEWGLIKAGDLIVGVHSQSDDEPMKTAAFGFADRAFEGKTKYSEWLFVPTVGPASRPASPAGKGSRAPGISPAQGARSAPDAGQMQPGLARPQ